jgi:hypothetical protein
MALSPRGTSFMLDKCCRADSSILTTLHFGHKRFDGGSFVLRRKVRISQRHRQNLCPRSSRTVLRSMPAITRLLANVCCRSWKRNELSFAAFMTTIHGFFIATSGTDESAPLNTHQLESQVGARLQPPVTTARERRAISSKNGAPGTTRTCDLLVRRALKRGNWGQQQTAASAFAWYRTILGNTSVSGRWYLRQGSPGVDAGITPRMPVVDRFGPTPCVSRGFEPASPRR